MAVVLIVDDDEDTRAVIHMALEDEGHSVREAADGESALEALRLAEAACVVMMDEHLSGISGARLLRQIAADPALRARHAFVLMSADTRAVMALQNDDGLSTIVSAMMLKPFDLYAMLDMIRELGDGLGDGHDGSRSGGSDDGRWPGSGGPNGRHSPA